MKPKNKIAYYLKIAKQKQIDLAEFVGVSEVSVSRWCNNVRNPRYDRTVEKICEFLNPHLSRKIDRNRLFYIE